MNQTTRGKQEALAVFADGINCNANSNRTRPVSPERKVVHLWIPRRFISGNTVDLGSFVADVNHKISERGFINFDGQLLRTPINSADHAGLMPITFGDELAGMNYVRVGEWDVTFDNTDYLPASGRAWNERQAEFFGLSRPYQMVEDGASYTGSSLSVVIDEPYLWPGELVAALVHGIADEYFLYCECHSADIVYTTSHRLICMGCGNMHLAIEPIAGFAATRVLSLSDWFRYFDADGELRCEEVGLATIDFREFENVDPIWSTDQWDSSKHRFLFFARSSPEVIEEAIRGTEADASIFLEAGWEPIELPPPPAEQLAPDSVDISLLENSAHAIQSGIACFLESLNRPDRLINAIPDLFRGVELLLKEKLKRLDPNALSDNPNNPTVLNILSQHGVTIDAIERNCIDRLRRLRNKLQHGTATFNYREALSTSRSCIVFINRFALEEVDCWLGDIVSPDTRLKLFRVCDLTASAREVAFSRLNSVRAVRTAEITDCPFCEERAVVRIHPNSGAACYYCGQPLVQRST